MLHRPPGQLLLATLSGLLLGLPNLYPPLFPLAWFAFVPLLLALESAGPGRSYLLGLLMGLVVWLLSSYWVVEFVTLSRGWAQPWSTLAALLFWLYAAQLFALIAVLGRWLRYHAPVPLLLWFPVLVVSVVALFPMLFNARLGEWQVAFPVALQGADITGAYGIDLMMALSSALAYHLLRRQWSGAQRWAMPVAATVLVGWFGYGAVALQQWDARLASWETRPVGLVQPDDAVSIEIPLPPPGYTRASPREMEMTARLAAAGAELVIWPEARYKGYFHEPHVRDAYRERIAELGIALLFHDLELEDVDGTRRYYNAAALLSGDGELTAHYRKIKRMAFGEYTPVFSQVPLLRELFAGFFGDFTTELTPGESLVSAKAAGMRLVPRICYESTYPAFIADSIRDSPAGAVLVVLSQNGWFGRTHQPFQHLRTSSLRAVENRVPMIHAINNGPSAVIAPSGRVVHQTLPFGRSETVVHMPHDPSSGGSFYSRHPRLFPYTVHALLVLILGAALIRRFRPRT